jgi:trans-aconitate methyltransferase
MEYPDYKTYATLYARYFREDRLKELIDRLPFRGNWVMDLCCGQGRVTYEALKRGADGVFAIDECRQMVPEKMRRNRKIHDSYKSIEHKLAHWYFRSVKVAVCQQAVNYWLSRKTAKQLAEIIEPGGIFAFNTFATCPSKTPRTMNYEIEGRQYWECSYLIDNMVHHVQVCEGIPPHVTSFQWLSEDAIHGILNGLFSVHIIKDGPSAIYRCMKI